MSVLTVLAGIKTVEESIALPADVLTAYPQLSSKSQVARAYFAGAASNVVPLDLPCFMNLKGPGTELRMGNTREDSYTVQVDFFGLPVFDEASQLLTLAYFDASWKAFDAERPAARRLGGALSNGYLNLRCEDDVPFDQSPNGPKPCCGFRIFLDIVELVDVS